MAKPIIITVIYNSAEDIRIKTDPEDLPIVTIDSILQRALDHWHTREF